MKGLNVKQRLAGSFLLVIAVMLATAMLRYQRAAADAHDAHMAQAYGAIHDVDGVARGLRLGVSRFSVWAARRSIESGLCIPATMPTAIPISRYRGLEALELRSPDGARATILLHGAHLVSWMPAGGEEQLYLSPRSEFASGQAIRGGVPVCFPQFASRGSLQKHGFARNKPWQLVSAEQGEDDALAVLRLTDDAASRMFWPHAFELELSVRISGRDLQIELACENTCETGFEFTAALHTYLGLADLDESSVQGLSGLDYLDSVDQTDKSQRVDLLLPAGELDRIYKQVGTKAAQGLTLQEQRGAIQRRVEIRQQGFEDAVVWNPGAAKCATLADMPADGYRQMLCIEAAAVVAPIALAAGASWVGMQSLSMA